MRRRQVCLVAAGLVKSAGVLADTCHSSRSCRHLSFLTLQRGSALRDALRYGFMPCRLFRRGRRASRTAYPRGAWARWCFPMPDSSRDCPLVSLRTPIGPHAPAWECPS
ncbi:DUF1534 domain-containing protein [Pseudomonas syringae]|nr:DUF1534 domain-containing protein [Pseudomonas syringae]MCF5208636.1 DUF1534 domain-containing protein [Pseudomonas syringae]MCF5211574.1 DUF1534 domain-containing protein [Pseudomonas syringae]MCF5220322.1 DUF1534 domain-containing protein [Pseudomonas syringae]MCF5266835.1 DUF1534 domain-containing protein [Pseudomonas syringae]